MKIRSIRFLYKIIAYLTDKTNGFTPFAKYKLVLGTLLIGISATSCKSNPELKSLPDGKTVIPVEGPMCYVAIPENPSDIEYLDPADSISDVVVAICPHVTCYKTIITTIPQIYANTEIMPSFPGGENEAINYIQNNRQYPENNTNIHGEVIVRFVVKENGLIENIQIIRSLTPEFDKEAVRIIQSMPKWIPGQQNGNPVSVYCTLPVAF
jgi:TonB family protein